MKKNLFQFQVSERERERKIGSNMAAFRYAVEWFGFIVFHKLNKNHLLLLCRLLVFIHFSSAQAKAIVKFKYMPAIEQKMMR